jgi:hypothetical protein
MASLADQAAAVWERLDTITDGPLIVQGNSMGSEVAMQGIGARRDAGRVPRELLRAALGIRPVRDRVFEKARAVPRLALIRHCSDEAIQWLKQTGLLRCARDDGVR